MNKWMEALKAESRYIGIAAVVFLTSAIMGYIEGPAILQRLKEMGIFGQLEQVVKSIGTHPTFAHTFATIFGNNLFASLSMMAMGLLFGLIPFMEMLMNGVLLGAVLDSAARESGQNPLTILIVSILPHGILEIPAAIVSAAVGIHLGMAILRRVTLLAAPNRVQASVDEWRGLRSRLPRLILMISLFLAIAALVETSLILQGIKTS